MAINLPLGLFIILLSLRLLGFVQGKSSAPFEVSWSPSTFGPDGPWQAIEVNIGENSKVALYPGHTFQSVIITTDYCKLNSSNGCYASKAGTYNPAQAFQDGTGSASGIQYRPPLHEWMAGMDVRGALPKSWVDSMLPDSSSSTGPTHEVKNVSLTLVETQMIAYPGGTWYPAFVGCLGVGAADTVNQSFTTSMYPINASLVPGMLWSEGKIESNSFGMHIGSVASRMPGSLWFGGYDQNRLIGDVLVTDEDFVRNPVMLKDISIEAIEGASPFNFTTQDGLLASGNSSINSGLRVAVDGCAPYLTLPKSTCDNIASLLPVTYNPELGLYFWDTESPKYTQIVSSATTLSFAFLSETNNEITTIRVPFYHLNLTLSEPLVNSPTQYFPCFTGGHGTYNLGRAFLQDAFLGANWGQSKWWLGQAPGPNIQLTPSVAEIAEEEISIPGGSNDWKQSWSGAWKVLTVEEANGTSSVDLPGETESSNHQKPSSGLTTGTIAGISVGAVAGGLGVVALVLFWCGRLKGPKAVISRSNTPLSARAERQEGPAEVYGSLPPHREEVEGQQEWPKIQYSPQELSELP